MQFNKVIGQDEVKQLLLEMVSNKRMPHAQIFLGPEGSGKLALALAYAQYVLCENKSEKDACGNCNACNKVEKLIHPDLHFSYPTIGTNAVSTHFLEQWRNAIHENPYLNVNQWLQHIGAENKQGNINKGECVSIIKKLSLKIFEGSHKVLIMWLPEYLGKEGNRLLKLIEEPPENTIFILVAENQELILNTILSRCQIVKVNRLKDEEVIKFMEQKEAIPMADLQSIAHMANGNLNEALLLKEQKENDHAQMFLDWLRKCYKGNGVELVNWVDKFAGIGRENQKQFLRYALHFLREYLALKMLNDRKVRLQPNELQTAEKLMNVIEFGQVQQIAKLFDDCSYYIERNANPKVLFLDASIQVNKILKTKVVSY